MSRSIKKMFAAVAALAALGFGAAAISGAASSSTSTSTGTSTSAQGAPGGQPPAAFSGPAHGTVAHEDAETPVTGAAAAKAQAAAVKAVGSGTAGAVTTDCNKTGYETTVTKADGTKVEVHLDSSFNVMQGPRGPGGPGHAGPPPGTGQEG
jgi:hypothetical protein